jgi:hypothetical protein
MTRGVPLTENITSSSGFGLGELKRPLYTSMTGSKMLRQAPN